MARGRIRVRLKSYDSRVIDNCCQQILDTAIRTGAKVVGPVPLPTQRSVYTINKSPFIEKDHRDHFEIRVHKRLIDIISPTDKTIDSLTHLELPAGVDIEIKM
ncbi:MAG: 30S ribosomal protein S10 [Candidatus Levybacteria bacterium RIFCSPHIGHO2_12_FULL_38_12]|nr:MAG: 30S ribosomal protein S10 [Candidatus Levybacteria bacterium RIFCSPHIGHO2_01_FULL_38_12]OGH21973.1 MAG: 30S ribosomal protein S10 [Candidatus Levybacteria bacterium RIFCSPHIGHO2_02_FULL_37_18]OGH23045.1 MAG: 30S ribosomal protein S10 [Candidatus Levybacteria bacterium RIFCSPHIGHO2_12_FULL_38_12]OGH33666.1 MAG: 30S ribosomal protein S10 [Candidatus Levybacteria bacterium RIFCSPLOWO2_01_FULL_37_20]OGH44572.1 MAG: 30S ribosomal protein S10 [Candidatus Levybacteria bacterium RIFCSPLOWO2_02_